MQILISIMVESNSILRCFGALGLKTDTDSHPPQIIKDKTPKTKLKGLHENRCWWRNLKKTKKEEGGKGKKNRRLAHLKSTFCRKITKLEGRLVQGARVRCTCSHLTNNMKEKTGSILLGCP